MLWSSCPLATAFPPPPHMFMRSCLRLLFPHVLATSLVHGVAFHMDSLTQVLALSGFTSSYSITYSSPQQSSSSVTRKIVTVRNFSTSKTSYSSVLHFSNMVFQPLLSRLWFSFLSVLSAPWFPFSPSTSLLLFTLPWSYCHVMATISTKILPVL